MREARMGASVRSWRAALSLVCLVSACEIEKISIPRTEQQIALHGVLSATATSQVVLLERTRNGSVALFAPPFDLPNPVVTDDGIAETGARVRLITPVGDTIPAFEDNITRGDSIGQGNYRFFLPGSSLQRGATYRVLVHTTGGNTLTAETSMPSGVAAAVADQRTFDRSRDTVRLEWPVSPGARSYFVRIETPFGPRSFFTDSTRVRLTGELRNVDAAGLPRVFLPGFPQAVTVSAVDSNFYDWYRSHSNRLSGTGLVNRVRGGLGVFGALVRLRFEEFLVVAPQTDPASGAFRFTGSQSEHASTLVLGLELYVESRSARSDQGDALSGRYERRPSLGFSGEIVNGALGTAHDGRIELALLRGWSASDTVDVFTGEIRGDTLVGRYRLFGGPVRFVRQP